MLKVKSFYFINEDRIRVLIQNDPQAPEAHIDYTRLSDFADTHGLSLTRVEHWVKTAYYGNFVPRIKHGKTMYFSSTMLDVIKNMIDDGNSKQQIKDTLFDILSTAVFNTPEFGNRNIKIEDLSISDLTLKLDKSLSISNPSESKPPETLDNKDLTLKTGVVPEKVTIIPDEIKTYIDKSIAQVQQDKDLEIADLKSSFLKFTNEVKDRLSKFKDMLKKNYPDLVNSLNDLKRNVEKSESNIISIQPDLNRWRHEVWATINVIAKELAHRDMVNHSKIPQEIVALLKDKANRKAISSHILETEATHIKNRYDWVVQNLLVYCDLKSLNKMDVVSLVKSQNYLKKLTVDFTIESTVNHMVKLSQENKSKCLEKTLGNNWKQVVNELFKEGIPKPNHSLLKISK